MSKRDLVNDLIISYENGGLRPFRAEKVKRLKLKSDSAASLVQRFNWNFQLQLMSIITFKLGFK